MRITTVIGAAVAAGALTLAFAQPASAVTHEVAAKRTLTYACKQTTSNGLGVTAITRYPKAKACEIAVKVGNAYLARARPDQADGKAPVTVRVDKTNWKCGTRQTEINPYIECVNQKDKVERAQFSS